MRIRLIPLAAVFATLLLIVACGGGGGGGSNEDAPTLSIISFPSQVVRGQYFSVVFSYSDPQGDITSLHYTAVASDGRTASGSFSAQALGIKNTSGRVTVYLRVLPNAALGQYTYKLYLVDAAGNRGNTVTVSVRVV